MNKIFNWGIIGPGRIAHKFAEGLNVINDGNLFAIASNNKDRADHFAKKHNVNEVYYSYKELVNDPNVDAIYIATPHRFHFEQTKLALEAGKPVLCEKPFTVNANEAEILIDIAKANNIFLMEGLWTRFLPSYKKAKSWIDGGLIGDIKLLQSTFGFSFPFEPEDRKFNHNLAGGALLDLGVYNISVSQWVTGENPKSFSAFGTIGKTNVDEMVAVTLEYDCGIVSQLNCNLLTTNNNEFIIYGTKGHIKIHRMFWSSTKVSLVTEEREVIESCPFRANGFEYQTEEVMRCINEGKLESPTMALQDTLTNMKLMDSIRKEIGLKYNFE